MYKCLLTVCAIWLLQLSLVNADSILIKFYQLQSNTTCGVISTKGENTLSGFTESNGTSTYFSVDHIGQENSNIDSVWVSISPAVNVFNVYVNSKVDSEVLEQNFTLTKNSELDFASNQKKFKKMYIKSTNFSSTNNQISACMNLGFIFKVPIGNKTGNSVDVVNIGCWTWSNNPSSSMTHTDSAFNLTDWADELNKLVCSSSITSLQITPYLALILTAVISLINK